MRIRKKFESISAVITVAAISTFLLCSLFALLVLTTGPDAQTVTQIKYSYVSSLFTILVMSMIYTFVLKFEIILPLQHLGHQLRKIASSGEWGSQINPTSNVHELRNITHDVNTLIGIIDNDLLKLIGSEVSIKDPLTKLPNLRGCNVALEGEIDRSRRSGAPFSIILVGMDNFNHINTTHGYPEGDQVLQEITALLLHVLRKIDIVTRVGGDKFMIILPVTDGKSALLVGHKLHNSINKFCFNPKGQPTPITASIGIASFPKNGADSKSLHFAVDAVLNKAKLEGKNCVCSLEIEDQYNFLGRENNTLNIRQAINEKRISLALQPIAGTQTGKVFAYEALARLSINGALVNACSFIEDAEAHGIIKEIDDCIFKKGILKLAELGPDSKMFFNFSPASFTDVAWMRRIPLFAQAAGVSCDRVVIEITEREALPNLAATQQIIDELRFLGIQFALDDFGSGFSSFLYVRQFKVDYLKIDGGFIRNILQEPNDKIIVESIQHVAKSFGLKTIAEFVEDESTANLLEEIGIDFTQGYYVGMPVTEELKRIAA